jgi:putative membrane protein
MILKRNFDPIKIIRYVWVELTMVLVSAGMAVLLYRMEMLIWFLPFSVTGILGSALAIFIAFRNNASYSRWWEARTLWGSILNSSRIIARQIINNADDAFQAKKIDLETTESFKKELILRQIAYAHALCLHLRQEKGWDKMTQYISQEEWDTIRNSHNIPNLLLLKQGHRVKDGIRSGILGSFDSIGLEPVMSSFQNTQGGCERIKNTPLMRQYHYFTRLFLYVFIITIPFSLIGDFSKMNLEVIDLFIKHN